MDEFIQYMQKRRIVNANKRTFYAQWVRNLYRYIGKNPGHPIQDSEIRKFLAKIGNSYQDWQVQQAQDAIRLYLYFQSQPKSIKVIKSYQSERLWSAAVDQMIAAMRLKHLALRTEKTYIAWMRQFYRYVNGVAPKDLDSQQVKNFLTHLAVERKVARATQKPGIQFDLILLSACSPARHWRLMAGHACKKITSYTRCIVTKRSTKGIEKLRGSAMFIASDNLWRRAAIDRVC